MKTNKANIVISGIACMLFILWGCKETDESAPQLSVDTEEIQVPYEGGVVTVGVSTNRTAVARIVYDDPAKAGWIGMLLSHINGTGDLEIKVAENRSIIDARAATISITAGGLEKTVRIIQAESDQLLTVDPVFIVATEAGGSFPVTVTSKTTWTATVDGGATWCRTTNVSGSNNGTFTVQVDDWTNGPDNSDRTATITVSGANGMTRSVTVAQKSPVRATNIALNKPVQVSDYSGTGNEGARAVDGNKTTMWVSDNSDNEHWIEINLQGFYTISAYALWRDLSSSTQKMKQFSLQAWIDDAWVTVSTEDNNEADVRYYGEFEPVVTNRVRWYIPAYTNNTARLFEIEIYGIPLPMPVGNITALVLENTKIPFETVGGEVRPNEWHAKGWKVNTAVTSGTVRAAVEYALGLHGWYGNFTNGKLYQTVDLDEGVYRFVVALKQNFDCSTACIVAHLGNDLPDYDRVAQDALGSFAVPHPHHGHQNEAVISFQFGLSRRSTVSLGFVANVRDDDMYFNRVELWKDQ